MRWHVKVKKAPQSDAGAGLEPLVDVGGGLNCILEPAPSIG